MKTYDREKKRWVTVEEYERTHKVKTRELCRGQKPHDFVLVLPEHITFDETYKHNPEAYYDLLDELENYSFEIDKKIKALGVVERSYRYRSNSRHYLCSVCKKKHFEWKE